MMRRIGDFLLGLGLIVGIGAIVGYELDIIPALQPAVLKLVLYKLIFVGGVGLLVAGAFIRRLAGRIEPTNVDSARRPIDTHAGASHALPSPPATEVINREPAVREKPPSIL
jgi:uncharacterized membrane protein YedE/YeeE